MALATAATEKSTFQDYSHQVAFGFKFDLSIQCVKVNLGVSFEQFWKDPHPNVTRHCYVIKTVKTEEGKNYWKTLYY